MSSADPSTLMATADSSLSTMKGPQNHNENGDPGSPKFYDTGLGSSEEQQQEEYLLENTVALS